MDKFWAQALTPFMAFAMLLIAWPIKRWLQIHMREGKLKRFLLDRRGDTMKLWFEWLDARIAAAGRRVIRSLLGRS